jgi:hypothetical protein
LGEKDCHSSPVVSARFFTLAFYLKLPNLAVWSGCSLIWGDIPRDKGNSLDTQEKSLSLNRGEGVIYGEASCPYGPAMLLSTEEMTGWLEKGSSLPDTYDYTPLPSEGGGDKAAGR